MNKTEKEALKVTAARIRHLASMETADFGRSAEYDKTIKDGVRPYMMWFECVASHIEALADAENNYDTQNALRDIFRYCN